MKRNLMIALFALTATTALYAGGGKKKQARKKAKTECCSNKTDCPPRPACCMKN